MITPEELPNGTTKRPLPPGPTQQRSHMPSPNRDLFDPVVPPARLNPKFAEVMHRPTYQAAREMMNMVFTNFRDVDRSFIREFQTGGFSARVFELALFAYLEERDLELDRSHPAPDFVLRGDLPLAIEVTTTNPAQDAPPEILELVPDDLAIATSAFVFQLAKALRRKLLYRTARNQAYWELPHVVGMPFVIAVGAFHDQLHPMGLVTEYLYGMNWIPSWDADGQLMLTPNEINEHHFVGRTIPSGLFRQPAGAVLSSVLFSNNHTMPMFQRIGIEQGLAAPNTAAMRWGTCLDPNPNAAEPAEFAYVVTPDIHPDTQETFADGLHLFINPWANTPLPPESLPRIAVHQLADNGLLKTTFPDGLHAFQSKTHLFAGEGADLYAHYHCLAVQGLLPPPQVPDDPG